MYISCYKRLAVEHINNTNIYSYITNLKFYSVIIYVSYPKNMDINKKELYKIEISV